MARHHGSCVVEADTPADAALLERRVLFSLGAVEAALTGGVVQARRLGGGDAGLYRVTVRLRMRDDVRLEVRETQPDLELAATRALTRAVRDVRRQRPHAPQRSPPIYPSP
jgi:hypothetical protein